MSENADPLDQAGLLTQQLNDAYISNARAKSRPEQVQKNGEWPHPDCIVCDEPLGERLKLSKVRCVACQAQLEKSRRFQR